MVPVRLHERRACQFPPSCSRSSPPPSSSCRPILFMYSLGMLAPGNRFRSILPPSPHTLIPSLLGISIPSSPASASVPRRCRRHDGADPISFRIKHRFIIARLRSLLRPRPRPSAAAAGRSGGNFFGSASPPGKCRADDARHVRVRAFLSGRRARKEEGRADLVEISFVP